MTDELQSGDKGFNIVARVIRQEGHCAADHQVGDEVLFDGQTVQGKVCMHALYSFLPKVFAMRYGAEFPWLDDPDVATHACPDAWNPVVFEIRRVRARGGNKMQPIATFSIVAYDPVRQEWGVAVQSKFLAVGAVVSWAQAEAGVVATQSYANLTYGPRGLEMMERGMSAEEVIETLTRADEGRALRQVGMVDKEGRAAAYTGADCYEWAGHVVGDGFACQGNILVPGTVEAMAERFQHVRSGPGELADWLVEALAAGQEAGGDKRGRQSASVLVVRENGGYGGNNDRYLDLRVDDDPYPIRKLKELVALHHLYFGAVDSQDLIPLADVAAELQGLLRRTGHYDGPQTGVFDQATRKALRALVGRENLEERWNGEGDAIDRHVVEYLRDKFSQ